MLRRYKFRKNKVISVNYDIMQIKYLKAVNLFSDCNPIKYSKLEQSTEKDFALKLNTEPMFLHFHIISKDFL